MSNTEQQKTPWRKNLDKRYISGEDLLNGDAMGKGLRPEMVVTLVKFNDAPAFNQRTQAEEDKTALWLKEYPNGKMLYKPCLLNVKRSNFLKSELANGSLFIDDCDFNKPFIIYAAPDKKHGHVVAFKSYVKPQLIKDSENFNKVKQAMANGYTMEQVKLRYVVSAEVEALLNGKAV